ncbi:efflux RND transporter periplasmic adaptor subunit [Rosistilla oblonga]|uniref:efflux RND transporter periplasmic adaptor subunit n=1 Tax=Rosistilla oblonga TaxID=2527990 RepID=UPI003A97772F
MNEHTLTIDADTIDDIGDPAPVPNVPAWKLAFLIVALTGMIVAAFFVGWLPKTHRQQALVETVQRQKEMLPIVEIVLPKPAMETVEVTFPGEIEALEETVIYARTSGYLKRWHVDIGDTVQQGQLLAEIDTPEVDQQLQQALANVEQLKARRQVAETKLGLTRYTLTRLDELLQSQAASRQEYDESQAEFAVAEHQVKVADADIAAGMAELQRIKELQSFAKVYAPFAGTITERSIDLGQLVTAGSGQAQSLFRLVSTDRVRGVVHVPQIYAFNIEPGEQAQLLVREMADRTFVGEVARTARSLDLQTRTMRIEIEFDNSDGQLLPGAYVQVRLPVRRPNPPMLIPASALIFNASGSQIATVNAENLVELRAVDVDADYGNVLGIATGIESTDRIVVNPGERLVGGMSVTIAEPDAAG